MNPAQRNRTAALLKASGFEDGPALTVQSTDGEIPHGRELSFAWLTGTVMTGLTSVLLMGAALYVSFEGQDTFSTAYEALQLITKPEVAAVDSQVKGDRVRPVAKTRSELEIVEASIRETVDGRALIRKQPFVRVRATLATAATALSNDIPDYDPVAMIDASQPVVADGDDVANPEIYGAEVEGEVQIKTAALPASFVPARAISDKSASDFVRSTVENLFAEGGGDGEVALAYAAPDTGVRDLGVVTDGGLSGVAENVSILPKTKLAEDAGLGRSERVVTIRDTGSLKEPLLKNGFDNQTYDMIAATLKNVLQSTNVPGGARLRILMGPARNSQTLIPHRLSIYFPDPKTGEIKHAATAALTDRGNYVLGLEPPKIEFPEEDTEEINVNNLPSVYRSIWETARKHDIDDAVTSRIVAMFAYDIDLTKRISAGDSIEILETEKDASGHQDLLYVALKLGTTTRELFRFRTDDGTVDFYDPDGETGKRFLTRRPLQGGGRLASRFGNRVHPIFKSRRMHTGVDLAAKTGTPIYASGDGVVEKAQWVSGYGKYVEIKHVNGFETGYGHQSRIADGIKPGVRVRQGQIIGYVGSTGNSTGPHLHFEIKVNGRFVDPLSVKLPRDKSLSAQYEGSFEQTIAQIRDLMKRDAAPMTVAALN
ncbi:M23 family metallopeptidase [Devosia sp. A16]|uniref:M23 family metallopeptidase n=1 Tax=Devosia sp. A16 TaxID=1736675 RepID=UPI0006D7E360|nr:M23 family metallopeptidase [Devosia sp. A16]